MIGHACCSPARRGNSSLLYLLDRMAAIIAIPISGKAGAQIPGKRCKRRLPGHNATHLSSDLCFFVARLLSDVDQPSPVGFEGCHDRTRRA